MTDPQAAERCDWSSLPEGAELLVGPDAIAKVASPAKADIVVCASWAARPARHVGHVGSGQDGRLGQQGEPCRRRPPGYPTRTARRRILPVDSEHSAVFQALQAGRREEVKRVVLTASGGPFRTWSLEDLSHVSVADLVAHPTWDIGTKVTIDSATLMNKALEIIEARWLFDLEPDQIDVVLHPQSIVHSLVEFMDGSIVRSIEPFNVFLPGNGQIDCGWTPTSICPAPGRTAIGLR